MIKMALLPLKSQLLPHQAIISWKVFQFMTKQIIRIIAEFRANGTVQERTWEDGSWKYLTSIYNLPLQDLKLTVTDGLPPESDAEVPILSSVSFSQAASEKAASVAAGNFLHVYYDATDTGRGINYANLRMRHEDGSSISAYDYDQDGIITFEIPTSASSGDYIFESFSIYDKASNSNNAEFRANGTVQERTWEDGSWKYLTSIYNLPLQDLTLTVTDFVPKSNPQSDWSAPVLNSISPLDITVEPSNKFHVAYDASDLDSKLENVYFRFKNDAGNTFSISDRYDDGILSGSLNSDQPNGIYTLDYVYMYDDAYDDNYAWYYEDGRYRHEEDDGTGARTTVEETTI